MIVYLHTLKQSGTWCDLGKKGWWPARPINWKHRSISQRFKESWMVFTGKADPFVWPEDEVRKEGA